MSSYRLILVLLCLAILGALPFIISLPKSNVAAPQEIALQQTSADLSMRAEIGIPLNRAIGLTVHRSFNEAEKIVNDLSAVPNKSSAEVRAINQVRQFIAIGQHEPPI